MCARVRVRAFIINACAVKFSKFLYSSFVVSGLHRASCNFTLAQFLYWTEVNDSIITSTFKCWWDKQPNKCDEDKSESSAAPCERHIQTIHFPTSSSRHIQNTTICNRAKHIFFQFSITTKSAKFDF